MGLCGGCSLSCAYCSPQGGGVKGWVVILFAAAALKNRSAVRILLSLHIVLLCTRLDYNSPPPPWCPPVGVRHVKDDLAQRLLEDGYHSVEEAVGADVDLS